MVNKSPRELLEVPSTWSIPQLMDSLAKALAGAGPALAFGSSRFDSVESHIAVVIPTSGSTGTPKEVALSAAALQASAAASHNFLEADRGQRWSLLLPTNHIAGVNVLVRALALESELVESGFDFTSVVPTQLFRALDGDDKLLAELRTARAVLVGGAAISSDLLARASAVGINVVTTYGMSEMSGGCIYNGAPLEGVEVELRAGGRIALRGPMQAEGYLGAPGALADEHGWFLTSDTGRFDGDKLVVAGRIDDQIISGGEKISLGAIDAFLNADPASEFMSCAIPSVEWGEQLCLASSHHFDQSAISQLLRAEFGSHAVPKLFLQGVELPRSAIGKADRRTLAQKFERMQP